MVATQIMEDTVKDKQVCVVFVIWSKNCFILTVISAILLEHIKLISISHNLITTTTQKALNIYSLEEIYAQPLWFLQ